jgi:hypothetical protein
MVASQTIRKVDRQSGWPASQLSYIAGLLDEQPSSHELALRRVCAMYGHGDGTPLLS